MGMISKSTAVTAEQVGRIDRVVQHLTGLSRSQTRGLFDHGCVRVNDGHCGDPGRDVSLGDAVVVSYNPQQRYPEKRGAWRENSFAIVHEDRDLIVVDKAAHVLTVPTDRGETNTLLDRVSAYLRHNWGIPQALVVQRLDRGVGGLLVFAKTRAASEHLCEQFRRHSADRKYVALVLGQLANESGTFRSRLATAGNLDRYSTDDERDGELAITHFRRLKQFADGSLVEVRLETGRRNQIRVHFAEAGHPVLGDLRYGGAVAVRPPWSEHRMALHAASLGFVHPRTAKPMNFESPLPRGLRDLIDD